MATPNLLSLCIDHLSRHPQGGWHYLPDDVRALAQALEARFGQGPVSPISPVGREELFDVLGFVVALQEAHDSPHAAAQLEAILSECEPAKKRLAALVGRGPSEGEEAGAATLRRFEGRTRACAAPRHDSPKPRNATPAHELLTQRGMHLRPSPSLTKNRSARPQR